MASPIDAIVDEVNAKLPPSQSPTWPLAAARIALGLLWLVSLRWKLPPNFSAEGHTSLREWLELSVAHPGIQLYADVIDRVVLPNFTMFAWGLLLTELAVGLSLLVGIGSRTASFVGLLMSLNLFVALLAVPDEWPGTYLLLIMWHGTLLVSNAGSLWSLGSFLPLSNSPQPAQHPPQQGPT